MKKRCGTIAIVGQPNVGKSTMLNYFIGTKLSITSRKAQTTRYQLLGIYTSLETQFIFIDTPGYQLKHLNKLNINLNKTVKQVLQDVDVILFVIEPRQMNEVDTKILQMVPKKIPVILVINKVDRLRDKSRILELINEFKKNDHFKEIIPTSVKKQNNLKELLESARRFLPEQDFIYENDQITDKNERFLAAEIIREKIFRLTGQEIPYSVAVEIEKFEHDGDVRRIFAAIIVERDAHKPIIIGNKGIRLKEISASARVDMEKLFDGKVWLETWVKVQKGWSDDLRALKSLGL
ncbi:GTPase Era [Nitrosomonadales bacterium]|nr:GTPase Era [Nitrosomonadales bacterium]